MIKLSHSGKNKFKSCAKSYELRYIDKLVPRIKGSPLFFGSAIDTALNHMLEHKDRPTIVAESKAIFDENWFKQKDNKYDIIELPESEDVSYFKSDFDPLLMQQEDWEKLPANILDIRNSVEYRKKDLGWYGLESGERILYNYSSWLSLSRKGHLFIDAYYTDIIPLIKRTVAVQMELKLSGGENAEIPGFIDAIVELLDGRIAVLDNKTSSSVYDKDSVKTSEQLALYESILNIYNADPDHSWKTHIDVCAYAVLGKKLKLITHKACKSCGHESTKTHAKCDNKVLSAKGKKVRCNGEWTKTYSFEVPTQFLVDKVPEKLQDDVLTDSENIIEQIENKVFPQNFESCMGPYGKCEFHDLCHYGSMEGLIDIKDKKK